MSYDYYLMSCLIIHMYNKCIEYCSNNTMDWFHHNDNVCSYAKYDSEEKIDIIRLNWLHANIISIQLSPCQYLVRFSIDLSVRKCIYQQYQHPQRFFLKAYEKCIPTCNTSWKAFTSVARLSVRSLQRLYVELVYIPSFDIVSLVIASDHGIDILY